MASKLYDLYDFEKAKTTLNLWNLGSQIKTKKTKKVETPPPADETDLDTIQI